MVRRYFGALLFAAGLAAGLVSGLQVAHAEDTKLRVGGLRVSGDLPLYIAEKKGFFDASGLDVAMTRAAGSQMIPGLAAEKLDIVFVNTISILAAKSQGFDLVAVAPAQEGYQSGTEPASVWAKADSSIKGPKDLAGKAIAVNGLNNINWLYAREWLAKNGVAPESVQFRELNFPQMPDALINGQIDAAYGTEPWQTAMLDRGAIRIIGSPFTDVQPGVPIALYVAMRPWAEKNEATVKAFVGALAKTVKFIEEQPAEARTLWAERDGRKPESTQRTPLFNFSTEIRLDDIKNIAALMKKHQLLKADVDLSNFIMPYADFN